MSVNSIGGSVGSGSNGQLQGQSLSINDFLHLFLSQLQFQDPLKPVDNTQFLAQLAQFTNIEQTQTMSDNISGLLSEQTTDQALSLLNRTVNASYNSTVVTGTVGTVSFDSSGTPTLTITVPSSTDPTKKTTIPGISMSQIQIVQGN